jgi:hypothetical protein
MGEWIMKNQPFHTLQEFWPYYVREHRQAGTRCLHFIGNTNLLLWLVIALVRWNIWIVLWAVVSSYTIAWIGHFFVERNIPATFRYPLKSALCDMRMYYKMWRGEMDAEVKKYVLD